MVNEHFKYLQIPWHIWNSGHSMLFISGSTVPLHRMFSLWLKITRHTKKENTLLSSDKIGSRTRPRNNTDVRTVRLEHCNYYMDMLKDLVLKVEQNGEFQQRDKSYFLRVRWKC